MPLLHITTNTRIDDTDAVLSQASQLVATMLGKPESYVMVVINYDASMSFAGDSSPCAYMELKSLGMDESATKHYSQQLCVFAESTLKVLSSRTYIEFLGPERHMWGWDKHTF